MSIENKAASGFANAEGYGGGLANVARRFIYNVATRGERKEKAKSGRPVTAEDWHNQEIAARYEHGRDNERTARDYRYGELAKNKEFQRTETGKDTQMNRDAFMADEGSRRRRTDLAHAMRTGAKYSAGDVKVNDGGGFSVTGTNRYAKPLKAVAGPTRQLATTPPKPAAKRAAPAVAAALAGPSKPRGTTKPSGSASGGVASTSGSGPVIY